MNRSIKSTLVQRLSNIATAFTITTVVACLHSQRLQAQTISSSCIMNGQTKEISGKNIDKLSPIASVSKIFTSLLALNTLSINFKFFTEVYVTPAGPDLFDVHLKGAQDPYFDKKKMHMVISKLNELGVFKIKTLTFDENIKYLHNINEPTFLNGSKIRPYVTFQSAAFPTPSQVEAQLKQTAHILKDYKQSFWLAQSIHVKLPDKVKISIENVRFLPLSEFKEQNLTKKIVVASQDLKTILKMMNWNSNNHSANQVFDFAGGLASMDELFFRKYNVPYSDFDFINGSGQNHKSSGDYNETTCTTVVKAVQWLEEAALKQNTKMSDILAVIGTDRGSTVGGAVYSNALTKGKVIAKSGTVGPAVTLAGVFYTKTSPYYFMINARPKKATERGWAQARTLVSRELQRMIKEKGGAISLEYNSKNPLDEDFVNYEEEGEESSESSMETLPLQSALKPLSPLKI